MPGFYRNKCKTGAMKFIVMVFMIRFSIELISKAAKRMKDNVK